MSTTFTDLGPRETIADVQELPDLGTDRRRFTWAVLIGIAIITVPYLWTLWDMWSGGIDFLRSVAPDNFYDIQARALFHGHLYIPNGSIGVEAFVYQGHTYTYFGLFPALLRMPILLVTSSLDGRLTAPSILLAWTVTGLFTSLLLWRTRHLLRGPVTLGWGEAACYGVFAATVMGGSVLVYIAASPSVYNEDMAWSVALTIGSLFALLGVLEGPSRRRVVLLGCLVLAANLDRPSTGYACALGAMFAAGWLFLGRREPTDRRFALSTALAGVVPLAVAGFIGWAKYRAPIGGYPLKDQVWTQVNAHRRYFLAVNGGSPFSLHFLPSTLAAYFNPAGLRLIERVPLHHRARPLSTCGGQGGARADTADGQHRGVHAGPLPPELLGPGGGVQATGLRRHQPDAYTADRRGRRRGRRPLLWLHLQPLLGRSAALSHPRRRGRPHRHLPSHGRSAAPRRERRGFAVGRARPLQRRRQPRHRSVAGSDVDVPTGPELPHDPTVAHSGRSVGLSDPQWLASVLGPRQSALCGTRMQWSLSLHRLCVLGLTGTTDHALDLDPGRAGESNQYHHRADLQRRRRKASGPPSRCFATARPRSSSNQRAAACSTYDWRTPEPRPTPGRTPVGWNFPAHEHLQYRIQVMTDPTLNQIKVTWYGSIMFVHYLRGNGPALVAVSSDGPVAVNDVTESSPDVSLCRHLLHG